MYHVVGSNVGCCDMTFSGGSVEQFAHLETSMPATQGVMAYIVMAYIVMTLRPAPDSITPVGRALPAAPLAPCPKELLRRRGTAKNKK